MNEKKDESDLFTAAVAETMNLNKMLLDERMSNQLILCESVYASLKVAA